MHSGQEVREELQIHFWLKALYDTENLLRYKKAGQWSDAKRNER